VKVVAKTDEYTIYQKRNERYGVRDADRNWVNGDAKVAILLEHKLIEAPAPKAPEPEAEAEEDTSAEAEETQAEGEAEGGDEDKPEDAE
jgi:hypothetical protein